MNCLSILFRYLCHDPCSLLEGDVTLPSLEKLHVVLKQGNSSGVP